MSNPPDSPDTGHASHIQDHHYVPEEGKEWGLCQYVNEKGKKCNLSIAAHKSGPIEDTDPGRPQSMRDNAERLIAKNGDRLNISLVDGTVKRDEPDVVPMSSARVPNHPAFRQPPPLDRDKIMEREGHKDDSGKTEWFYLPFDALEEVAEVMAFGAHKYNAGNYRKGMRSGRLFSACTRHIVCWWRGQDNDPESGKSHLAHAICCLLMLREQEMIGTSDDNRYVGKTSP